MRSIVFIHNLKQHYFYRDTSGKDEMMLTCVGLTNVLRVGKPRATKKLRNFSRIKIKKAPVSIESYMTETFCFFWFSLTWNDDFSLCNVACYTQAEFITQLWPFTWNWEIFNVCCKTSKNSITLFQYRRFLDRKTLCHLQKRSIATYKTAVVCSQAILLRLSKTTIKG